MAQAAGVLLSGLLLWEVVVRGNLSLSIAFLEEMWSRNLGHLFVSPIRSWEMATGIIIAALLRTLLGLVPVSLMAWAFFGYNDLHARPAADRLLRHPADVLLVDRARHVRHDHAGGPERRELRLGRRLHPDAGERRLLSGERAAASGCSSSPACLPPAYVFEGMRAILLEKTVHWHGLGIAFVPVGGLPRDRLPDIPVVLPPVAPCRHPAGAGRVALSCPSPPAYAGGEG